METPKPEPVLRLADAIGEGDAVDWQKETSEQPGLRQTLDSLKVVESILKGYRSLARTPLPRGRARSRPATRDAPPTGVPESKELFRWGTLRVIEKIGEGSFGEVYRAHDPSLDREVALKLWRSVAARDAATERFLLEARRLARVRHPTVLIVHGADLHDGRAGMWTDLIHGQSLEQLLAQQGPFGARETALIGIELCGALAAVHNAGLVHRDVKTTNVMRERGGRIVLMDFGAVGELTPFGTVRIEDGAVGTPLTVAPEQLEGAPATPTSDLYSLGVLMYRLLTAAYPVEAHSLDELRERHRLGERTALRERRPDLPAAFVHAVERALDPPASRHQGPGAMERSLADALAIEPGREASARPMRRAPKASSEPATAAAPRELPEAWTRFRGREEDVLACTRLLEQGSALAITGPAGAGKTRLALHLAERHLDAFPGGVRFVDLEGVSDPDRVTHALATAFGVRGGPGRTPFQALVERLKGPRALVVVDGCDRVLEATARAGEELLRSCVLAWVTTSRRAVGTAGERTYSLAPLSPPTTAERAEASTGVSTPNTRVPFVGRDRELAILSEAIELTRQRNGRLLLLTGEAGVGKSRLMEEAMALSQARGLLCLGGRCSYRGGRNFEPFIEALEDFSRRFAPAAIESAGAGLASGPRSLFATVDTLLDPRPGGTPEPRSREQIWHLIDGLLKRIARYETLALFFDDLHWADEGTLSLLNHVARHLGGSRILIVGCYRPEEVPADGGQGPAVEDAMRLMSSAEAFVRVPLPRLDATASASLVGRMLRDAGVTQSLAPTIHERAQGNPFFTIEIVRYLAAAGPGASPGGDLALPQTVTDVVMRRLARLTAEERDALDLAAVEGERFHTDTLEAGTGRARLRLLKTLRALEQVHHLVVTAEEGHRFSHGLIRDVLLGALPAELEREYHGIVATHWMRRDGDRPDRAGRIADQLFEAHRYAEALPRFLVAAREARRLFLHDRALGFLDRGLEAFDRSGADPGGRGEILSARCAVLLLLGRPHLARAAAEEALRHEETHGRRAEAAAALESLGETALAQGDLDAAERFLERARQRFAERSDLAPIARCDQKLGAAATRRGDFEQALVRLGAALECVEGAGDALGASRIRVDLGDVHYRRGDYDLALQTFEQAVAELRRLDQRHDLSRGLNRLGNALFQSGQTERAEARYREALGLASELDDFQSVARLEANLGNVHLVQGDPERALESYRHALESFEEIGDRTGAGQTLMALGNVCFTRGQLASAADHYRRTIDLREAMGDRQGLANALDNLGVVEVHLGRFRLAQAHHEAALRLRTELGDRPGCAESALNLGTLMAILGDRDAALRLYSEADGAASELGDPRRKARVGLALACLRLWSGDRDGASALLDSVASLSVDEPAILARRFLLEGLSRDPSSDGAGEAALRQALAAALRSGSCTEQATARLALAERLLEWNRGEEVEAELDEALELLGVARVPLLELHGLRLRMALLSRRAPPDSPEFTALEARVDALSEALREGLPGDRAAAQDFREPPFPIP